MEFIPYAESSNENLDSVFDFKVKNNSEDNPKIYKIQIVIDPLNDGLILSEDCECKGHKFKKVRCKHIKYCLETLSKFGVEHRDGERKNEE